MELTDYFRFFLALVFVLSLIGLLAWLARRLGAFPGIPMRASSARRIRMVESVSLDARRRAVLIQRDDVEHLILLGPTSETVIETGIQPPRAEAGTTSETSVPNTVGQQANIVGRQE